MQSFDDLRDTSVVNHSILCKADEPYPVGLHRVAGSPPKARRSRVVLGDDRGEPNRASCPQAKFALAQQRGGDPLSPSIGMDGEPIKIRSPSVPGGDQRSDHCAVALSQEQRLAVGRQQSQESFARVGDARRTTSRVPQGQHRLDVSLNGASDRPVGHDRDEYQQRRTSRRVGRPELPGTAALALALAQLS